MEERGHNLIKPCHRSVGDVRGQIQLVADHPGRAVDPQRLVRPHIVRILILHVRSTLHSANSGLDPQGEPRGHSCGRDIQLENTERQRVVEWQDHQRWPRYHHTRLVGRSIICWMGFFVGLMPAAHADNGVSGYMYLVAGTPHSIQAQQCTGKLDDVYSVGYPEVLA